MEPDSGKAIYETFMDVEPMRKAFKALRALKKDVIVYYDGQRYAGEYTKAIETYLGFVRLSINIIDNIEQVDGSNSGGGIIVGSDSSRINSSGDGGIIVGSDSSGINSSGDGGIIVGSDSSGINSSGDSNSGGIIVSSDSSGAGGSCCGGGKKSGGLKKFIVIDPKRESELLINTVKPIFGDRFNHVTSSPVFFEFLPPGTSKGRALEFLAAHLGVGLEETVAAGDYINDISMIKAAGLGVAVANATREVIEAADYVTASNNCDGIAKVIEMISSK